jgi:hypothetical protein
MTHTFSSAGTLRWLLPFHGIEGLAALGAEHEIPMQSHRFVRLDLVPAESALLGEIEVGLPFESRRHWEASALRTS